MTLQDTLKQYLEETNTSMRALSLAAGLGEKAVSDILRLRGLTPKRSTLIALERATGRSLVSLPVSASRTYGDLISELSAGQGDGPKRAKSHRQARRLRWLMRKANWVPETRPVCRREVVAFFESTYPAAVGVSKASFATYKSEILSCLAGAEGRNRRRGVADIEGPLKRVHERVRESDLPLYQKNGCGSFLVFLFDRRIEPRQITTETLRDYYEYRLESSCKGEAKSRRHVKEMATLVTTLAARQDFADCGFVAVSHPFMDARDRYGVSDGALVSLLQEFDDRVAPWALGQMSNQGELLSVFLERLDAHAGAAVTGKKALLRRNGRHRTPQEKSEHNETLLRQGYLPADRRWSQATLRTRRGYVVAAAKALMSDSGYLIESIHELTDPEVVGGIADALSDANAGKPFHSDYVASVLKAIRKIAVGYCTRPAEEIRELAELIQEFETGHKGVAARNKAKLQAFTKARILRFLGTSDEIISDVNGRAEVAKQRLRKAGHSTLNLADVYDAEMIRDVMAAVAHDILIARAPRTENVVGIRLDWIRWTGACARIVVPAAEVKMRSAEDRDLVIPLTETASKRMGLFVDRLRPLALQAGDARNPYLFPAQRYSGNNESGRYGGLLQRLSRRVSRVTGVPINPHLYRHLIGWIWLKDNPDKLPAVQKLLGHKWLQTTLDYYAEIDEDLALDQWQEYINETRRAGEWGRRRA